MNIRTFLSTSESSAKYFYQRYLTIKGCPLLMPEGMMSASCPEDTEHHFFLRQSRPWEIDRIKNNYAQTGCPICGLVCRALEIVHEDLGIAITAESKFHFWGQSHHTLTTSVVVAAPRYYAGQREFVYEVEDLR